MGTAVIVEAVRTPIGRRRGALAGLHPAELLGHAQSALLERAGLRARRGRAGRRRLCHPGGRASGQCHPDRLAARGPAEPGRLPDAGRPVRIGPAGRAPDRWPDRGRRDRCRHRLRRRGDEPDRARGEHRLGHWLAATAVLGDRHAEPVRGRRADRAGAVASRASRSTRSACAHSRTRRAPGQRAGSIARWPR